LGTGYDAKGSGKCIGRTGDGGIDGAISEDVLGLDIIVVQARQYEIGSLIGPTTIELIIGALDVAKAKQENA